MTIWENILSDFDKNPLKIARILASANVKFQIPPAPATWTHPGQSPPRGQNQPLPWASVGLLPVCPSTSSTSPHRLGGRAQAIPRILQVGGPEYPPLLCSVGLPGRVQVELTPKAALRWWQVLVGSLVRPGGFQPQIPQPFPLETGPQVRPWLATHHSRPTTARTGPALPPAPPQDPKAILTSPYPQGAMPT